MAINNNNNERFYTPNWEWYVPPQLPAVIPTQSVRNAANQPGTNNKFKNLFKWLFQPGTGAEFKNTLKAGDAALSRMRNTRLLGGPRLGTLGAIGMGLSEGTQAVQNMQNVTDSRQNLKDLIKNIKGSAYSNPLYAQYLTSDQKDLFNQVKRGYFTDSSKNWGNAVGSSLKSIPSAALKGLAGYLVGGIPGAVIGAGGSLINSGLQGYSDTNNERSQELQNLYNVLQNAEQEYNYARRPRSLNNAVLQQRMSSMVY